MSLPEERSRYFFSCAFTWWIAHYILSPFDNVDIETDEALLDHIDAFDEHAEETAAWLLGQCRAAGVTFMKEGNDATIHECMFFFEHDVTGWIDRIAELSDHKFPQHKNAGLYCLLTGWMHHMLVAFDREVSSLQKQEFASDYPAGRDLIHELNNWLSADLSAAAEEFFQAEKETVLDPEVMLTYESLEESCRKKISEAVGRFTRPEEITS